MLELPKLIVILLVLIGVWYVRRWFNEQRRDMARRRPAARTQPPAIEAEDLVPCAACGAYVSAGAAGCGRRDCPQRR